MKATLKRPATHSGAERERRKAKILKAASKLFAARGYAACDIDRVAAKLKIAKGTIYLYFRSKEELFRACVAEVVTQMQQKVQAAAESQTEPFRQMAAAIRAYLEFFAEHPDYVELLIQEQAVCRNRGQSTYFKRRDSARVYWRRFYQQLIDEGRLRPNFDVESILNTIGNLVFGTMFTNHFIGPPPSLDEQYQRMLEIVLQGVLSEKERGKGLPKFA